VISIHPTAHVSKLADIEDSKSGSMVSIGPESHIDSFVRFRAAGGQGDIVLGRRCFINSGTVLYIGNGIHIGDYVSIAANCTLAPTNHSFSDAYAKIQSQGFKESKGGIRIEDDVWIGAGTVILDGATIRRGAVIAAMSLVRGEIPELSIWGGNPIRELRARRGSGEKEVGSE